MTKNAYMLIFFYFLNRKLELVNYQLIILEYKSMALRYWLDLRELLCGYKRQSADQDRAHFQFDDQRESFFVYKTKLLYSN